MIKYFTISVIIALFVFANNSMSNIRVHSSAAQTSMQTERINNIDYVNLKDLSKLIFPKSTFNEKSGSIRIGELEIKCSVGSFFVLFRDDEDIKVSQMNLPAISFKQNIFVPIKSFIDALVNMNLIKADFTESGLFVEINNEIIEQTINAPAPNQRTTHDNVNRSSIEKSKINVKVAHPTSSPNASKAANQPSRTLPNLPIETSDNTTNLEENIPTNLPTQIADEDEQKKVGIESIPTNMYFIPKTLDRRAVIPGE